MTLKSTPIKMKKILFSLVLFSFVQYTISAQSAEQVISEKAVAFDDRSELVSLLDYITGERLILMGEASHGTSEFYTKRSFMSKHLASEQGFNFIAVEGDWSSFSRINEYVKHKEGGPHTLDEAMAAIDRWPLWMWRNQEFKTLVRWLHEFNADMAPSDRVGLYGIDVYDNYSSMEDVVEWISSIDSGLGNQAGRLYSCMSRHPDPSGYVQMVAQTQQDCSDDIEEVLEIVRSLQGHEDATEWEFFKAEHGAKVAVNAELHYRANLQQGPQSWNYRASHFYLTAERLLDYYGEDSRGIIWAHNTHIGDARATDMGRFGMHNIGQLSRDALGTENTFAIGFGTYTGEVLAGREWEGAMRSMNIPEAPADSWEHLLMQTGHEKLYLNFGDGDLSSALQQRYPHRAIGVTYNPANEQNNFVPSVLPDRYNAFIFIHTTKTLDPLD
jgi:erythromycin esterase